MHVAGMAYLQRVVVVSIIKRIMLAHMQHLSVYAMLVGKYSSIDCVGACMNICMYVTHVYTFIHVSLYTSVRACRRMRSCTCSCIRCSCSCILIMFNIHFLFIYIYIYIHVINGLQAYRYHRSTWRGGLMQLIVACTACGRHIALTSRRNQAV
jgi:hypothetical protein